MSQVIEDTKEIPRVRQKNLTEPLTLWVEPEVKRAYSLLKERHKVSSAECMRIVMRKEIARLMELHDEPFEG